MKQLKPVKPENFKKGTSCLLTFLRGKHRFFCILLLWQPSRCGLLRIHVGLCIWSIICGRTAPLCFLGELGLQDKCLKLGFLYACQEAVSRSPDSLPVKTQERFKGCDLIFHLNCLINNNLKNFIYIFIEPKTHRSPEPMGSGS